MTGWDVLAGHGGAELSVPAGDGYVHPSAAGLTRFRIHLDRRVDPASLLPGAFRIVGHRCGDVSHLVASAEASPDRLEVSVTLSEALVDADRYTIHLTDLLRDNRGWPYGGQTTRCLSSLAGDVNGSGDVTPADMLTVRGGVALPVDAVTGRLDVDGSGSITGSDMLEVRRRLGNVLP